MAFSMIRQGDTDQYDIVSYCCDKREDVDTLPITGSGSSCIVLEDSSVWMLSNTKEWKEL